MVTRANRNFMCSNCGVSYTGGEGHDYRLCAVRLEDRITNAKEVIERAEHSLVRVRKLREKQENGTVGLIFPPGTVLKRLEANGSIVPNCAGCEPWYEAIDPLHVFAPRHKALGVCKSGQRPHCTCSICF